MSRNEDSRFVYGEARFFREPIGGHPGVRQGIGICRCRAGCVQYECRLHQPGVGLLVVHRVFRHDEFTGCDVQSEQVKLFRHPVVSGIAADDDLNRANPNHGGRTHATGAAIPNATVIGERPVTEPRNNAVHGNRFAPLGIKPVAKQQSNRLARTRCVRPPCRLGIDHGNDCRMVRGFREQRLERVYAVTGGAATAAVGRLDHQHRPAFDLQSSPNSFAWLDCFRLELVAFLPVSLGQALGHDDGICFAFVGHHQNAAAHVRQVQIRMYQNGADRVNVLVALEFLGLLHDIGEWSRRLCLAVNGTDDDRHLGHGHNRFQSAGQNINHRLGAALAGLEGIDVRIGFPRQQCIGVDQQLGRDVRVQVERADDRHRVAHPSANCTCQVALHVGRVDCRPGAMQAKENAVEFARVVEPFQ